MLTTAAALRQLLKTPRNSLTLCRTRPTTQNPHERLPILSPNPTAAYPPLGLQSENPQPAHNPILKIPKSGKS